LPPRRVKREAISPIYATVGPNPAVATRRFGAERADELLANWRAWRTKHGAGWDAGGDVPEPPHWRDFT
jgi:hypothetical protein